MRPQYNAGGKMWFPVFNRYVLFELCLLFLGTTDRVAENDSRLI